MKRLLMLLALAFAIVAPGRALADTSTGDAATAAQLERDLIAPCCWRQQVAVHDSPVAQEIRQDVRVRLARGESRQAILDAYVAKYGTAVLVEPPARGFSLWLYVLPPAIFLVSGVALVGLVRRFSRGPAPAAVAQIAGVPVAYDTRLDDDLAALD